MPEDMTFVPIPTALCRRVEAALGRLGQATVETFVTHVVRTALTAHEMVSTPAPDQEPRIVDRLRRLGYID
jgi:hypothetical protein